MILRSRRKPPITAQNIWATTSRVILAAPGLSLFLGALMLPWASGGIAHAEDGAVQAASYVADAADPGVEQASYTVGESGHRYKWMPYQPKEMKKVEPLRAEAAQFTGPAPAQTEKASAPHPLDDPFGDHQQARQEPTLPDVHQFLADDSDKKPLKGLMTPPSIGDEPLELKIPSGELGKTSDELPTTEDIIAQRRRDGEPACKNPDDILYPIAELDYTTGIRDTSIADPENRPHTCDLVGGDFIPRQWAPTAFMWQASGLCHKPAYFEDVQLERYGHSWGPYVQPLMSGAHFFLNVPVLPYKMGLYPPNECIYTLGYYRPGSCAPYMLDPLPLSVRAALVEAGAAVGMAYLLP